MTLPANIRVNIGAPFPALIKGSGPIAITKKNGIWTVGFTINTLPVLPGGVDTTQVYILVYNATTGVLQQTTIASLPQPVYAVTKINHANSPYAPVAGDTLLLVDTTGGAVEIDLPLAINRTNPLAIKDWKGNAAVAAITIKPTNPETVDGFTNAAPLILNANYDGVVLRPDVASYVILP